MLGLCFQILKNRKAVMWPYVLAAVLGLLVLILILFWFRGLGVKGTDAVSNFPIG